MVAKDGPSRTIVAVFASSTLAQRALSRLIDAGVPLDDIGIITRNDGPARAYAERGADPEVGQGAKTGAIVGAGTGALWAAGAVAGVLPAIGPLLLGGLLPATLAGAVGGAAAGGLSGARGPATGTGPAAPCPGPESAAA